jgi:hypothetical protein
VHAQLEAWLRDGKAPDDTPAGEVAKQGIQKDWLPVPGKSLLVEHKMDFYWRDGIQILGFIDCADPSTSLVLDHKTTSNLKYAMTPEQLHEDPQALLYASWAAVEWDTPIVTARWVYYSASNPKSGPRRPTGCRVVEVPFDFLSDPDIELVDALDRDIKEVYNIKAKSIPGKELPPTPSSCGSYGGCPHRERCDLSGGDLLKAYFGG